MELTEQIVMNCLFSDEGYVRKALPYVDSCLLYTSDAADE